MGVKRPGCEADRLPLSSDEVKKEWSYTSIIPYFLAWRLINTRDSFTLLLKYMELTIAS
jgi:hypothetical protein